MPVLQNLVQTLSTLIQSLQAQIGAGGNTAAAQADAGANTLGGGPSAGATGGCGCGGAAGAVGGVDAGGSPPVADTGGAAGAPSPQVVDPKQQDKIVEPAKASPAPAASGNVPPRNTTDINKIKAYINVAAGVYGTNAKVLTNIAQRESTFNASAVNHTDSNAQKGTPSQGMFQYIKSTFNSFAPQAKAANPKAWQNLGPLEWMDWRQQALTTAWAIEHGHSGDWSTFGAAKAAA